MWGMGKLCWGFGVDLVAGIFPSSPVWVPPWLGYWIINEFFVSNICFWQYIWFFSLFRLWLIGSFNSWIRRSEHSSFICNWFNIWWLKIVCHKMTWLNYLCIYMFFSFLSFLVTQCVCLKIIILGLSIRSGQCYFQLSPVGRGNPPRIPNSPTEKHSKYKKTH